MRILLPLVLPALLPFLTGGVNALATPRDGVILPANATLEELTKTDPAALVNLFVGTTNGGHSFPGATLPHGLIKVGLDTDSPGNQAGYDGNSTFNATGFSQMHDQGTGGAASLSNFKLWPLRQCHTFLTCASGMDARKMKRKTVKDKAGNLFADDAAEPGWFATNLSNSIHVELTSTRLAALHSYTFPPTTHGSSSVFDPNSTDDRPRILVDITNDGQRSAILPFAEVDPSNGARVTGGASFQSSFGLERYNAFVCVDWKLGYVPVTTGSGSGVSGMGSGMGMGANGSVMVEEFGAYTNSFPTQETVKLSQLYGGSEQGILLTFPPAPRNSTSTIFARVGVSFISTDKACANAENDIPDSSGWDFQKIKADARAEWNDILGKITLGAGSETGTNGTALEKEQVELFYSSLYRTHIVPADYTGENPKWNSTEPYYDSMYCNWDTFRTLYPLFSLHSPTVFSEIVRAMIDIQQHEGWLPECRGATTRQFIQGGSNGDPILGEWGVKFANYSTQLNVSLSALFDALVQDSEVQSPNWDISGRQANIWKEKNYIPVDVFEPSGTNTKQVSRALEYAFGDFSTYQIAKIVGNSSAQVWANRSMNFINNWDASLAMPGMPSIKGFMQPRFANGTFNFTDPRHCSVHDPLQASCFLNAVRRDGFYESSPIVYSQFAPHDVASLVKLQGGPKAFINRLDFIFENDYFDSTDEPSFNIPFMYHYANQPASSIIRARNVINSDFNVSINGLPGNDDSGAMGSYVVFILAGLYPVPSTRQYLIVSPWFPQINFTNPLFGTTTSIIAKNFNGNPTGNLSTTGSSAAGKNIFVKSVSINGTQAPSNCYLDFDVFEKGGVVELEMTNQRNVSCGAGANALPPSLSTGGL